MNGIRNRMRKAHLGWLSALFTLFLLAGAVCRPRSVAFAAEDDSGSARAVRLSTVEGQVQVTQDGQVIADHANANLPLFEGAQITTGNDGRTELQMEDGSVVRLSPNTTVTLTVLQQQGSDTRTEIVLNGGLGYFELQPSTPNHTIRVSYGPATFSPSSFAVVRLNLDNAPGSLAVFSGDVHFERSKTLQLDLHGGESLSLNPSSDAVGAQRYSLSESIATDSWDAWNADQDQQLNQTAASQTDADNYINNQPAGMSDLDANGNWYNVPGQGLVWSPYEALNGGASWDPYGYGNWVYYPRFGYVFTSGYNWGYAPYQCGTWNFFDSFGWGWAPGYGCNSWYGNGGGGWAYNIGNYPRGYRPPRRPLNNGPINPRGGPRPVGGHTLAASVPVAPVVPVDRRPLTQRNAPVSTLMGSAHPITVSGRLVQPLRPLTPRVSYDGSPTSIAVRSGARPSYSGSGYSGSGATAGFVPRVNAGVAYGASPAANSGAHSYAPNYRPQPTGSSGGGRPAAPPPSRPSPSFGGGSSHPSGGSSGGGGHSSGGSPHK